MGILRCGNTIRLVGIDANSYLLDTGKQKLPTQAIEYNAAMQELKRVWAAFDTPEGRLIAATCFAELDII
jgi:ubiquinone/menaquinone biosynthesis C-methylase UbiE